MADLDKRLTDDCFDRDLEMMSLWPRMERQKLDKIACSAFSSHSEWKLEAVSPLAKSFTESHALSMSTEGEKTWISSKTLL